MAEPVGTEGVVPEVNNTNTTTNQESAGNVQAALYNVVRTGKLINLKTLINKGANVNQKNIKGMTPLHYAAREGRLDMVEALLGKGVDVKLVNNDNQTALHLAAMNGRTEVVKALLGAERININPIDKFGRTPLTSASSGGHTEVVKLLLNKNGIDVTLGNPNKKLTPFQAAKNNEIKVLLLEKDGAINSVLGNTNTNKQALLRQAITNQKTSVVQKLINAGAKVNKTLVNLGNDNLKKLLQRTFDRQQNMIIPKLGIGYNYNETLKKYLRTKEGRRALLGSYKKQKSNFNNNSLGSVFNLLKRSEKLTNISLNNLSTEYTQKSNLYNEGNERRAELVQAAANATAAAKAKAVARNFKTVLQTKVAERKEANANAAAKAKAKEEQETINKVINSLNNPIKSKNLTNNDLKLTLKNLSTKNSTNNNQQIMKKLLKIWIEKGETVNSAGISKNLPLVRSLESYIANITRNYKLRQNYTSTSGNVTQSYFYNTPEGIKKALLTNNGRKGIIKSYGLDVNKISIPEIINGLHGKGKFKTNITKQSLKRYYEELREAFSENPGSVAYRNLGAAINNISKGPATTSIGVANANAKVKEILSKMSEEQIATLLNGNTKIGLVLKSNGSPYKLVNYTKINKAIKNFKATGKNQNLNNNDIITNAANGTWSLVEVSKNLIKPK